MVAGDADLTTGDNGLPDEALEKALVEVKQQIAGVDQELADLQSRLERYRAEQDLMERLLAVRRNEGRLEGLAKRDGGSTPTNRGSDKPAVAEVIRVLEEARRPVHISELMRLVRDKNISIPGAGQQVNLISHLRRDPAIVRPSRGMYGLAGWGLRDIGSSKRTRRRRRGNKKK